jgi:prolyl-tRNA editing enzyme YbaK/EbsC (Cys-tRNA(Pro) deacylase)
MATKQTPATRAATRAAVSFAVHEYDHDPSTESYALEAAAKLGVDPARVFKTLRPLPTYVDDSATHLDTVFVSAGRRGLEIELASNDLISLTHATVKRLRRDPPPTASSG